MSAKVVLLVGTLLVARADAGRLNQRQLLQQPLVVTTVPAAAATTPAAAATTPAAAAATPAAAAATPAAAATTPAAAAAPTCTTIRDTQLQTGALCISQLVTTTATEVLCDRYEPGCVKATSTTAMLSPNGDALSNPAGFQQSADAACRVLGYAAAGSGGVHMTGVNAKRTCWNGQKWAQDNWWTSLVCCK